MLLWFQYKNRTGAESAGLEKVIEFIFVNNKGYLAKLGFWFKIKARVKILPQAYN